MIAFFSYNQLKIVSFKYQFLYPPLQIFNDPVLHLTLLPQLIQNLTRSINIFHQTQYFYSLSILFSPAFPLFFLCYLLILFFPENPLLELPCIIDQDSFIFGLLKLQEYQVQELFDDPWTNIDYCLYLFFIESQSHFPQYFKI